MALTTKPPSTQFTQIILFSHPRTACHLLERMLTSKQPDLVTAWNLFAPARPFQSQMLQDESIEAGIPTELRERFAAKIVEGVEVWRAALTDGKLLFRHEHHHFALDPERALRFVRGEEPVNREPENFMLVPEDLLLTPRTIPIFTIRHPALTTPALYKALEKFEGGGNRSSLLIASTQDFTRELYSWYISHGISPIIVEAEDYMASPSLVRELARKVGLRPEDCVFEWEEASEEEEKGMNPMYVALQQTLLKSTGVVKGKIRRGVSIQEEVGGWEREFGVEGAALVRECAEKAMEGYEFLRERKLRVPPIE